MDKNKYPTLSVSSLLQMSTRTNWPTFGRCFSALDKVQRTSSLFYASILMKIETFDIVMKQGSLPTCQWYELIISESQRIVKILKWEIHRVSWQEKDDDRYVSRSNYRFNPSNVQGLSIICQKSFFRDSLDSIDVYIRCTFTHLHVNTRYVPR